MEDLTVIIPTWNNHGYLMDSLYTMKRYVDPPEMLIIANNGDPDKRVEVEALVMDMGFPSARVAHFHKNIGDGAAFNNLLPHVSTKYVAELNDDVFFVPCNRGFWRELTDIASEDGVGCVGPVSDGISSAVQNIKCHCNLDKIEAVCLHGFCMVWKTSVVSDLGGFDLSLPGGYDLDISIRMRVAGLKMVVDRMVYLGHVGGTSSSRLGIEKYLADTEKALRSKYGDAFFDSKPVINGRVAFNIFDTLGMAASPWIPKEKAV